MTEADLAKRAPKMWAIWCLSKEGVPQTQIAKRLGVAQSWVSECVRKVQARLGLPGATNGRHPKSCRCATCDRRREAEAVSVRCEFCLLRGHTQAECDLVGINRLELYSRRKTP